MIANTERGLMILAAVIWAVLLAIMLVSWRISVLRSRPKRRRPDYLFGPK